MKTVLIVEDEADCAAMLEVALETVPDIALVRVTSAEGALSTMASRDVSAIISDLQLPGMSGLELVEWVAEIPIVIVSASTSPGIREEALRMGAVAFFAKPFSPAAVCKTIRELLKESGNV